MSRPRATRICSIVFLGALLGLAPAQEFDFMPRGAAELLVGVLQECDTCDDVGTLLTSDRSREEWRAYFEEHDATVSGLTESQLQTLAGYLAIVAPVAENEVPNSAEVERLPMDGRMHTLQQCMNCHGITAPITQSWGPERWISHFESGTHSAIGLAELRKQLIANYLGHNTLSLDEVPEAIRGADPAY